MENPVTNLINAGCYIFSPEVIDRIPLNTVVSVERETFPALVAEQRPIFGYHEQAYWLDVGTPAALFKGSRDLVVGDFHAMADCVIAPDAKITGGTSIGARCQIGTGAQIEDCIIGDDVIVGDGASLTRSFVAHGAVVAPGAVFLERYLSKSADLPISL
jgi:mannose-1-phosphate guanylyltransferase